MTERQGDFVRKLDEVTREVKQLRDDLYGNERIRQAGVFDRLGGLEKQLTELRNTYERERVETGYFARIESEIDALKMDYRVALVYLKGLAGGVGTILVGALVAAAVAAVRYFLGGP